MLGGRNPRRRRRTYDPRLVALVRGTGDVTLATRLGVPRSTAAGWVRRAPAPVVTAPVLEKAAAVLLVRIARLEKRLRRLTAVLRLVLAMTEIRFSNSLIEAWWRSLKHQWLFLHRLDSAAGVRRLVEFYVEEHNARLPHAAFEGQTPDEMYFGTGDHVPGKLPAAKAEARRRRLEVNRAAVCGVCV